MQKLGIWNITKDGPRRISATEVDLESHLENWIEADPQLVRAGLAIVARQMKVEGGRLDLLALDPQGRWVVIEIKRGTLLRDTVAQAIDYASCISAMPAEELEAITNAYLAPRGKALASLLEERDATDALEPGSRELQLVVVGAGKAPGLDRMVGYLADQYSVPITLVAFDVFELQPGQRLLAREITEPEMRTVTTTRQQATGLDDIVRLADSSGIGAHFAALMEIPKKTSVYPRPFKLSIMYTPPARRDRMLFTAQAYPTSGKLRLYISPSAIAEFFPVSADRAEAALGAEGWHLLDEKASRRFSDSFIALVAPSASP